MPEDPSLERRPLGKADGGVGFECSRRHVWINTDGLSVHDMIGGGDTIYAATYRRQVDWRPATGGLTVLDASDFTDPRQVAYHELELDNRAMSPLGVEVVGDVAYVVAAPTSWGSDALWVIELDSGFKTSVPIFGGAVSVTSVAADGVHAFVGTSSGVRVVWVREPSDPREIATIDETAHAVSLQLHDDKLYVGTRLEGAHILDVSDPRDPRLLGQTAEFPATDIALREDGLLFVMSNHPYDPEQNGLRVVDVSDPSAPTTIGSAERPNYQLTDIEVRGDAVYMGWYGQHPLMYDVSEPTAPTLLHWIRTSLGSELAVGDAFFAAFRPATPSLGTALMTSDAACLEAELGNTDPDPGPCAHDLCVTGLSLERACDPCVAEVCAVDDFCCNNRWDSLCVEEAESMCELSCG